MSAHLQSAALLERDEIVAPPALRACGDQSFEFPTGLYGAMAAMLFGFMAVMAIGFASPGLVVPIGIIVVFLTAFFAIPCLFVTTVPDGMASRALRWSDFMHNGVETETGHTSGGEAFTLVLILPFLILCWGIAVSIIAAVV